MNRFILLVISIIFVSGAHASTKLANANAKAVRSFGIRKMIVVSGYIGRAETSGGMKKTNQAVKDYYLDKANLEWADHNEDFHSIKWCKNQIKALRTLNKSSWTKHIVASSSGTCLAVMEEGCPFVFGDSELPTTGTLHFLRDEKGQAKSFSIPVMPTQKDIEIGNKRTRLKKILFVKDKAGHFYLLYDPRDDTRSASLQLMNRYEVDFIDDLEGRKFDFNKLAIKTIELTDPETNKEKSFPLARPIASER